MIFKSASIKKQPIQSSFLSRVAINFPTSAAVATLARVEGLDFNSFP
ncbi:MAG: hypothetical protein R3F23_04085 [Verrucomicrobiia bacterium]